MFDHMNLPANITQDYKLVLEYGKEAATVIDKTLRVKSFAFHVPHKHRIANALTWDRHTWGLFDSLPQSLRNMVNEDSGNVDANLQAALDMWRQMIEQAEKAMDRIIGYEYAIKRDGLPDWLTEIKSEEYNAIATLKAEREAEAARLAAERKEKEAEAARRRAEEMNRMRHFGGTYVSHTVSGQSLSKIEVVDTRGLPPHLARLVIENSKPLVFERHEFYVAPHKAKITEEDAKRMDEAPPATVHPSQMKRGRNF